MPTHAYILSRTHFENVIRTEYPSIYRSMKTQSYDKEIQDLAFRKKCKEVFKNSDKQNCEGNQDEFGSNEMGGACNPVFSPLGFNLSV